MQTFAQWSFCVYKLVIFGTCQNKSHKCNIFLTKERLYTHFFFATNRNVAFFDFERLKNSIYIAKSDTNVRIPTSGNVMLLTLTDKMADWVKS